MTVVSAGKITFLALGLVAGVLRASSEDEGRQLFTQGRHLGGTPLEAKAGDSGVALPPSFVACAQCHGGDARGRTEAGTTSSDIRWGTLSTPYSVDLPRGRRRGPYDAAAFLVAVTRGLDSAGNPLNPAMPRFSLTAKEAGSLIAYLSNPAPPEESGVTETTIRVGIAPATSEEASLLHRWADHLNASRPIYRRQLELVEVARLKGPESVAAVLVGEDRAAAAIWQARRVPVVSFDEDALSGDETYGFALYPGLRDRVRVVAGYAASHGFHTLAIIDSRPRASEQEHDSLLRASGLSADATWRGDDDVRTVSQRWARAGVSAVLVVGDPADAVALAAAGRSLGWNPLFLSTEPSSGGNTAIATLSPSLSSDVSEDAAADLRAIRMVDASGISQDRAMAWVASGRILEAALEQAGRGIDSERLEEAFLSLDPASSGLAPAGSFARTKHVAARGLYVIPAQARTPDRPEWINLD